MNKQAIQKYLKDENKEASQNEGDHPKPQSFRNLNFLCWIWGAFVFSLVCVWVFPMSLLRFGRVLSFLRSLRFKIFGLFFVADMATLPQVQAWHRDAAARTAVIQRSRQPWTYDLKTPASNGMVRQECQGHTQEKSTVRLHHRTKAFQLGGLASVGKLTFSAFERAMKITPISCKTRVSFAYEGVMTG